MAAPLLSNPLTDGQSHISPLASEYLPLKLLHFRSECAFTCPSRSCAASTTSEMVLDRSPGRKPFRPLRSNSASRPHGPRSANHRPPGIRPPGDPRHAVQNARNNYERYTTMAKDAARRGEVIEAENFYQHAEHYFRVMREQNS
jgi:Domain of unknown function (DUF4167)